MSTYMTTDLPTKCTEALSRWRTFLGVLPTRWRHKSTGTEWHHSLRIDWASLSVWCLAGAVAAGSHLSDWWWVLVIIAVILLIIIIVIVCCICCKRCKGDTYYGNSFTHFSWNKKGKGSPYSITERRVLELIPVLGSQSVGDVSHKPGSRLPLLSARPAVTLATLKRAATSFAAWWTEAQWVCAVCLRLLPDSVAVTIWTRAFCTWVQHANHSATKLPLSWNIW